MPAAIVTNFSRASNCWTELPDNASDDDYAQLQDQMDELAPDVSRLAWGHKYFSLLFPNKLDDYHSPDYAAVPSAETLAIAPRR